MTRAAMLIMMFMVMPPFFGMPMIRGAPHRG